MKETLRHLSAYEFYYNSGNKLSYSKVAKEFSVSETSIKKWAKAHSWKERAQLRDDEVAKRVEEKTTQSVVNIKAEMLNKASQIENILTAALKTAIKPLKAGNLVVTTPSDLNVLTLSWERINKMRLLLLGEATDRTETNRLSDLSDEDLENIVNDKSTKSS